MKAILLLGHFVAIRKRQLNQTTLGTQQTHIQMQHHALTGQAGSNAFVFGGIHRGLNSQNDYPTLIDVYVNVNQNLS